MTLSVLPTFPGLAFPVDRSIFWNAIKQDAVSGARTRFTPFTYPIYRYTIDLEFLRRNGAYGASSDEFAAFVGFYNSVNGPVGLWAYNDPNDNTVTAQAFGDGDGATTAFQLVRGLGGFIEPVFAVNGSPVIKVAGVTKTLGTDYTIGSTGIVTFAVAPASGAALTWTGSFYWCCRFDDDQVKTSNFMANIFEVKAINFSTEKLA